MLGILKLIELIAGIIPYPVLLKIGSTIGLLGFYLDNKHRRLAITNIIKALKISPIQAQLIAKKSFNNFGKNVIEFLTKQNYKVQAIGSEYVKRDKGNIFVLGHFGNWEVLGRIGIEKGLKITAVGREMKSKDADRYVYEKRIGSGLEIVGKKGSFKYLLESLKKGRSVGILIDQYAGKKGVFVDFFGMPTSTTGSPVILSIKTGCSILPVFIIREGLTQKIIVEQPIQIIKTGNVSEDIKTNTQLMVKPLEKYVRKYPEQWWWVHRRWRS